MNDWIAVLIACSIGVVSYLGYRVYKWWIAPSIFEGLGEAVGMLLRGVVKTAVKGVNKWGT